MTTQAQGGEQHRALAQGHVVDARRRAAASSACHLALAPCPDGERELDERRSGAAPGRVAGRRRRAEDFEPGETPGPQRLLGAQALEIGGHQIRARRAPGDGKLAVPSANWMRVSQTPSIETRESARSNPE